MNVMKSVAITTLGCKINQFESAAMHEKLSRLGYLMVRFTEPADIYIINTCTVTARTDAESRRLIRRARRLNAAAKIVVTGCYAQVAHEELREMPGVNLIIGNSEKRDIDTLLNELGTYPRILVSDISREANASPLKLETFTEHTRAFLQIQNGCNEFCTYCIVPYARGRSRSVPCNEVLSGIRNLASSGFREVVLTGIHLGAYGLDLQPSHTLLDILQVVEQEAMIPRLRLGSMEPQEITTPLVQYLANSSLACHHLHIPLQSGSDSVLLRMGRRYNGAFFREKVMELLTASPDICIGADVIAGFPGETAQEFSESLRLIAELPLSYLHIFPFSPRKGTPAADMPGQVSPATITARAKELRDLGERKLETYYQRFQGREISVLCLNEKNGVVRGLSRNYLQITVPGDSSLVNREVMVLVTGVQRGGATGNVVRIL
jgi:threonylcarbamoyladenosine tRNA methylthiotransferase MtaB